MDASKGVILLFKKKLYNQDYSYVHLKKSEKKIQIFLCNKNGKKIS